MTVEEYAAAGYEAPAQEVTSDAQPQAAPAETLTELQEKALEIADRYKDLPLQAKIDVIAQAFGCKTGEIHTSPCTGKWRGTSDMTIRFDNGASLFIGNHLRRKPRRSRCRWNVSTVLWCSTTRRSSRPPRKRPCRAVAAGAKDNEIAAKRD